jgi:hypothetical protein
LKQSGEIKFLYAIYFASLNEERWISKKIKKMRRITFATVPDVIGNSKHIFPGG